MKHFQIYKYIFNVLRVEYITKETKMINFSEQILQKLENFKGGEKYVLASIFENEKNKILKMIILPGASIGMHTHTDSSEIIYIIKGKAKFVIDGKTEYVCEGDCHVCPQGSSHTLINDTDTGIEILGIISKQ